MKPLESKPLSAAERRRRAEAQWRARPSPAKPLADADTARLLQELEVHQIELEMQNEELLSARPEIETSLEKYAELYDFAPISYLTLGEDSVIQEANLTAAAALGMDRAQLIGRQLAFFTSEDTRRAFRGFLDELCAGKTGVTAEVTLALEGREPRQARLQGTLAPKRRGQPKLCRVVMEDITERKRAEAAVRESEARFRTVADFTYDWEFWISAAGLFLYVSPSCQRITGYTAQEYLDNPGLFLRVVHPEDRPVMARHLAKEESSAPTCELDFRIVTRAGEVRWIHHACQPVYGPDGQGQGRRASNRDVTARKRAEDRVEHLTAVLRSIRKVTELMVRERDPQRLLAEACHTLAQTRGYRLVWIGQAEAGSKRVVPAVSAGQCVDYLNRVTITWDESPTGLGPTGTAMRTRRAAVCQDTRTDPRFAPWREAALASGFAASAAVPLAYGDRLLGVLSVYASQPGSFDEEEVKLLEELADDLAFAVRSIENETERKQAETALRKSRELLRETGSIGKVGGWEFNVDTREQTWTEEVYRIHEVDLDFKPTVERGIAFYAPETRPVIERAVQRAIEFGESFDVELPFITAKGNHRWVHAIGHADREQRRVHGCFQDITKHKRLEAERAEAMARLALVQEEERQRVSRELHDQTVQQLAALAVELKNLETGLAAGQPQHEQVRSLRRTVDELQKDVRELAWDLRATGFAEGDLESALREYLEDWSERAQVDADCECLGLSGSRLPVMVESTLYRVAQEALANVKKHAQARHVSVLLERDEATARLTVEDDGCGFDVDAVEASSGKARRLGRLGMKERVALAGGTLVIESSPGAGTTILVRIPVRSEAKPS